MSTLHQFTRLQLMDKIRESNISLPFTTREVFDAVTDGFIDPAPADLQLIGFALRRMGFRKRRVVHGNDRKPVWYMLPKGQTFSNTGTARDIPWANKLLDWAEQQDAAFTLEEALYDGADLTNGDFSVGEFRQAADILRMAGYANRRVMVSGYQQRVWQKLNV